MHVRFESNVVRPGSIDPERELYKRTAAHRQERVEDSIPKTVPIQYPQATVPHLKDLSSWISATYGETSILEATKCRSQRSHGPYRMWDYINNIKNSLVLRNAVTLSQWPQHHNMGIHSFLRSDVTSVFPYLRTTEKATKPRTVLGMHLD